MRDFTSYRWSHAPPDLYMFSIFGMGMGYDDDFVNLPFGSVKDPIKQLLLHCTWSDLSEEIVTDNAVHSDLEPMEAPQWSISAHFEDQPSCILGKCSVICKLATLMHATFHFRRILERVFKAEPRQQQG